MLTLIVAVWLFSGTGAITIDAHTIYARAVGPFRRKA
jgi:hypothetical protein